MLQLFGLKVVHLRFFLCHTHHLVCILNFIGVVYGTIRRTSNGFVLESCKVLVKTTFVEPQNERDRNDEHKYDAQIVRNLVANEWSKCSLLRVVANQSHNDKGLKDNHALELKQSLPDLSVFVLEPRVADNHDYEVPKYEKHQEPKLGPQYKWWHYCDKIALRIFPADLCVDNNHYEQCVGCDAALQNY